MKHLLSPLTGLIFLLLYLRVPMPNPPAQGDLLAPITQMIWHMTGLLTLSAVLAALLLLGLVMLGRFFRSP